MVIVLESSYQLQISFQFMTVKIIRPKLEEYYLTILYNLYISQD